MTREKSIIASLCIALVWLVTGCYAKLSLRFGNGTDGRISVESARTGQQVEIRPKRFKKFPYSSGDLFVMTQTNGQFQFANVSLLGYDMDPNYLDRRGSIFGPACVTLTVLLETNMELYVLVPGKRRLDPGAPQPTGYPKTGQRIAN
jgi:hypothetical protein